MHGPGWSKFVIGDDCIENWRDYIDVIAGAISDNGGRSCINASAVVVQALPLHRKGAQAVVLTNQNGAVLTLVGFVAYTVSGNDSSGGSTKQAEARPSVTATARTSLPLDLQRIVTADAMRASLMAFSLAIRAFSASSAALRASASARALAREIADNTAPVSVALIRQMMWRMMGADDPMEAHKVDSRGIYARGRSDDVKEGVVSFLEKRPAQFKNKVSSDMPDYFPWWDEREYK